MLLTCCVCTLDVRVELKVVVVVVVVRKIRRRRGREGIKALLASMSASASAAASSSPVLKETITLVSKGIIRKGTCWGELAYLLTCYSYLVLATYPMPTDTLLL